MIWKSGRAIPSIFGIGGPGGWLRKWSLVCGGPVFFSFLFFFYSNGESSERSENKKQANKLLFRVFVVFSRQQESSTRNGGLSQQLTEFPFTEF